MIEIIFKIREIILKPEQKFKVKAIIKIKHMGILQRYIEESMEETSRGLVIPFYRQNVV